MCIIPPYLRPRDTSLVSLLQANTQGSSEGCIPPRAEPVAQAGTARDVSRMVGPGRVITAVIVQPSRPPAYPNLPRWDKW